MLPTEDRASPSSWERAPVTSGRVQGCGCRRSHSRLCPPETPATQTGQCPAGAKGALFLDLRAGLLGQPVLNPVAPQEPSPHPREQQLRPRLGILPSGGPPKFLAAMHLWLCRDMGSMSPPGPLEGNAALTPPKLKSYA